MKWTCLVVLGLSLAVVSPVAAQGSGRTPTDAELAEARHSFDVATAAFEAGDYETAVSEFRASLELSGAADLYFNIYLSEERAGELEPAAEALDQYLQRGTVDDEQRALLTGRLARLRARIASHTPTAAPEEPQALLSSPIEASAEPVTPPRPSAAPVSSSPPVVGIALLATAGVLAVSFGVFAGLSFAENQRLDQACGRACPPTAVDTLRAYDIVADVSWITAAVAGVTGLVLLFALPPESSPSATAFVAPWMAPSGAGFVVGGSL